MLREYCYKNQIDYPYSAEDDLSYNPGENNQQVPIPGAQPYYGAGQNFGPPPSGFAPAPTYYAPAGVDTIIYPAPPAPGIPQPHAATPAADFSKPANNSYPGPAPSQPSLMKPASDSGPSYPSSGYTLPPPPSELNLPKYGDTSKPAEPKKPSPAPAKKDDSDDSDDDEDLMARLKNLQK